MARRIAVVGSRDFENLELVAAYVRALPANSVVISGGARGVDQFAVDVAKRCQLRAEVYLADWASLGAAAGYTRNRQIVAAVDELVAFWDGSSRGTANSIKLARERGLPVAVVEAGAMIETVRDLAMTEYVELPTGDGTDV